ncbi:MAG: polyprenyl synthetase family protein [Nanoarchaeota archaeon]|nr:polyprenyl synthetase family protein [Nanoarchaeota archaeon]
MEFEESLEKYRKILDREMSSFFDREIGSIESPENKHIISLLKEYSLCGGKRLRPISLIMAFNSFSGNEERIVRPSLAIELLHTSSLVFDDIMDEDDYRRDNEGVQLKLKKGYLTKNKDYEYEGNIFSRTSKRYAASISMLIGLYSDMLARKILFGSRFSEDRKNSALEILNNTSENLVLGQALDIELENTFDVTEQKYLDMIFRKTGSLYVAGLKMGALLGGAKKDDTAKLGDFGRLVSVAFQVQDDIMDVSAEAKKGRMQGSDILKGKKTLLLIKAIENADDVQKKNISEIVGNAKADKDEINKIIEIYNETGAVDYCRHLCIKKIIAAKRVLQGIEIDEKKKEFFYAFADYMLKRKV